MSPEVRALHSGKVLVEVFLIVLPQAVYESTMHQTAWPLAKLASLG